MKYETGMLVRHPAKPEWQLGKVLAASGQDLFIYFKGDHEQEYRRFRPQDVSLEIVPEQPDPVLDNLPPFKDQAFQDNTKWVSIEDGITKFSRLFPLGFEDPDYLGGTSLEKTEIGERNYKLAAHDYYMETLGHGQGEDLLAKQDIGTLNQHVRELLGKKINIVDQRFETPPFFDALDMNEQATAEYYRALFEFIATRMPDEQHFSALADAMSDLPTRDSGQKIAKWTLLTAIPFVADYTHFMYLKPKPTKECAARLRFEIQYSPELRWISYRKLLDMSNMLLERLRPLGARDYIDVQSFIYIISEY